MGEKCADRKENSEANMVEMWQESQSQPSISAKFPQLIEKPINTTGNSPTGGAI